MQSGFETIHIASSVRDYDVVFDVPGAYVENAGHSDIAVVADARFRGAVPFPDDRCLFVEADEREKSLERMAPLIERLKAIGGNRKTHVIAMGGGVVQDIATFVCSIYMRGLAWTYVPTTLLAMVDSCIGGKSSINVGKLKNLVGGFYPPEKVVIDPAFVATLELHQVVDGLCEAVKICYARGNLDELLADIPDGPLTPEIAGRIVRHSLLAKKWFIEEDEFDQGIRLLLNFGHTFGHALEAISDYRVSHGVGVGIGILVAEAYARRTGRLTEKGMPAFRRLSTYIEEMLAGLPALPGILAGLDPVAVVDKFDGDKKHWRDCYRIVVPIDTGCPDLISIPRTLEQRALIADAFAEGFARVGTAGSER